MVDYKALTIAATILLLSGTVAGGDEITKTAIGDPASGAVLYQQRCGACHSLDQNRIGPMHRNLYGAAAGAVDGFAYSPALADLDVTWTDATLDAWLLNPGEMAPGTRMGYRLPDAQERADIIAYLRAVATAPDGAGSIGDE